VTNEEDLEQALDRVDPEIFLLSPAKSENGDTPLETLLDLLAAVPAGKLAIADLPLTTREDVLELERAGCDAVIVRGPDIAPLAGGPPPVV
jgi:indole-3-glycerol phosphate synthase